MHSFNSVNYSSNTYIYTSYSYILSLPVNDLRSEKPLLNTQEFELASRTIVILWEIEKQQTLHVHIELPLDLYREACDAHKNGKEIRILGKPRKGGKFWTLLDHHGFEVI